MQPYKEFLEQFTVKSVKIPKWLEEPGRHIFETIEFITGSMKTYRSNPLKKFLEKVPGYKLGGILGRIPFVTYADISE